METGVVIVVTTFPTEEAAREAARGIIQNKLAACAHISPVTSVYRWEGEIVEDGGEFALAAKTDSESAPRLLEHLRAHHPYTLPELLITPVIGGDERYLDWVKNEVRPA